MLASQRQERILAEIKGRGAARIADLVGEFDVSGMTVRRDIAELARKGLVRRVHGGAIDSRRAAYEPGFQAKSELAGAEKAAIARAALGLVRPGNAIALSAGTTTHMFARLLADCDVRPLTVLTNSLRAGDALHRPADSQLTVVLTGGTRTPSDALVGPLATQALAGLRVDLTFLGVHGLDVETGLTTPNLLEAETDRAMVAAAGRLIVLADHTKWGVTGLSRIADLAEVDVLVTDAVPDDVDVRGLEILLAPTDGA